MDSKKRTYIKDSNHVNLDALISKLRINKFYGKMEITFESGIPRRVYVNESIKLDEKEFKSKTPIVPVK